MAKKVTKKDETKKSLKKVKSFNLDDKIYNDLMEILEASGTQTTLSALVNDFLRKLYVYLIEADGIIKREKSDLPLSQVIYDSSEIEYFRTPYKKDNRVLNLIWSRAASANGQSLVDYLLDHAPELVHDEYPGK